MALANGRLEGVVPLFLVNGSSGASLRFGSCARWNAIRAEVHELYGWWPEVTSAGDGYRSLARQETLFFRNYKTSPGYGPTKFYEGSVFYRRTANTPSAATPGTSNHGLGTTVDVVDLGRLNDFTSTRYKQFAAVAARHGFSNAEGRSIGEPWHWTDTLDPDDAYGASAPEETDDMSALSEQQIAEIHAAIGAGGAGSPGAPTDTVLGNTREIKASTNGIPQAFATTNGKIDAVKADTAAIKAQVNGTPTAFAQVRADVAAVKADTGPTRTDVAVIKGGVATLLERPAAGDAAKGDGEAVVITDLPAFVAAVAEAAAEATLARLASIAVTITPEV